MGLSYNSVMASSLEQLDQVTLRLKANLYFDGKVVSHTVLTADGRKTVGVIYPGSFKFNTEAAERMDIIAGSCRVRVAGESLWKLYSAGQFFCVPEKSSFEISVEQGVAEYLCTFEAGKS
jgi:purine/pyrimidine-nucleoside phosphorylase